MDPFVYQYTVGGVVFGVGLAYAWAQGVVGLRRASARRNLALALGGLFFFAALQGYLQYAPMGERAPKPYQGGWQRRPVVGTPLDYAVTVLYFASMLAVGIWFGRRNRSTRDFFFGGQRFSWWLIAFSLVATTVGSYSFVKYSRVAFTYGIASSQTYLNDWFWMPLLLFGWLPLLYFNRLTSIPEYFQRRFGDRARHVATALLLVYLVGYVGINLFTMGKALNLLVGWPIFPAAFVVAALSAVYVTFGGQTSVIMTDLFQGVVLLLTGLVLLALGMGVLGGPLEFWETLPRSHRMAFPHFNADPSYPAVGVFWQDGMANSAMFYFLNQGIAMRLLAARSVGESRKAAVAMMVVLMPVAALVVASGGWVARALVEAGKLPPDLDPDAAFFVAAELLTRPGLFGLVVAALTATLMSPVDTLITAIAAIAVNDIYRPRRPQATDAQLLRVARYTSVGIAVFGVALVPVFASFGSIYAAHGAFTAAVTPPLVVALLLGVFWRRYTPRAALWTMVGGSLLIFASILWPQLITPLAHGVPMKDVAPGFLAGKGQYKFMRGLYGLVVCGALGVVVTLLSKARPLDEVRGLVWGTVDDARRSYGGAEAEGTPLRARPRRASRERASGRAELPVVWPTAALVDALGARAGDLVFLGDARSWLGGLRSAHAVLGEVAVGDSAAVELDPALWEVVVAPGRDGEEIVVRVVG